MVFEYLNPEDEKGIANMSARATDIVREHLRSPFIEKSIIKKVKKEV